MLIGSCSNSIPKACKAFKEDYAVCCLDLEEILSWKMATVFNFYIFFPKPQETL